jgi:hypothetical protein
MRVNGGVWDYADYLRKTEQKLLARGTKSGKRRPRKSTQK